MKVFYDEYEQVNLWGKDLYQHLDEVYRNLARLCVIFVSSHYASKLWTLHENRSAQARALEEQDDYILPARFDDTEVPGLRPTVGYVDLRAVDAIALADMIVEKVGHVERVAYLPDRRRYIYGEVGATTKQQRRAVDRMIDHIFRCLVRATPDERRLLWHAFYDSCGAEKPFVHVNLDWVARSAGMTSTEVVEGLRNMRSFGLKVRQRKFISTDHSDDEGPDEDDLLLEWMTATEYEEYPTIVARCIMRGGSLCEDHSKQAFAALDLTYLDVRRRRGNRCLWGSFVGS